MDYFSHDTDVSTDDKIEAFEVQHGPAGYALYFKCLERIYRNGGPIDIKGVFRPIMSAKLRITPEDLDRMLHDGIQIDLFYLETDGKLMSEGAKKRLAFITKERESDRNRVSGNIPEGSPADNSRKRGERKGKGNKTKGNHDLVGDAPDTAQQILDYLNVKAKKGYRMGKAHKTLIEARIKEGFSLDDFKKVIDNKVADWGSDDKMEEYLRPSTLFQASKMDGYLNRKASGAPRQQSGVFQRQGPSVPLDLEFIRTGTE